MRQVTMFFVDLVGSTEIATALGNDGMADLLDELFDAVAQAVRRYGGTVAELTGDGALCIFGLPTVHEDDPERALRAVLGIARTVSTWTPVHVRGSDVQPQVRIGVHTGTVLLSVMGQTHRLGYAPVGDHVHLAARLQSAAQPSEILVSQATAILTASLFRFGEPRSLRLKGFSAPQAACSLDGERETAQRRTIETSTATFVGRSDDLAALLERSGSLVMGLGGVVTLWGEAGMGKSRLLAELRGRSSRSITWIEGRGLSYAQHTPYSIIGQLIRRSARISEADTGGAARSALRNRISDVCGAEAAESIYPFVATALGMQVQGAEAIKASGEALQTEIFRALGSVVTALAQRGPLVLVFEDLHWSDRASIAALDSLLPLAEEYPVLFLLVARPDTDAPSWTLRQKIQTVYAHLHHDVTLGPLTADASSDLAMRLLETERLPRDVEQLLLEKAEGIPLFVEQLVRALLEQGAIERGAAGWRLAAVADVLRIPDTVQGIILARFDRLNDELKRLLQAAAVLGPQVVRDLLNDTLGTTADLGPGLRDLQRRGFLRETRRTPESVYVFCHALIRDVAYQTMRRRTRLQLHARAAMAMERIFSERLSEFQTIIAEHFVRAERWEEAAGYLLRAGDESARLHAHTESRLQYAQAAQALARLPDTAANLRRRVDAVVKRAAASYTAEPPQDGLARLAEAQALIDQIAAAEPADAEDRARLARVQYWAGRLQYISGKPGEAMKNYRRALAAGEQLGDHALVTTVSAMMGAAMAVGGQFESGRRLLQSALPKLEMAGAWREWCLSCGYLGASVVACGEVDEGLATAERGVARALELRGPYLIAMTRTLLASAYAINERMDDVRVVAQQAIDAGAQSGEPVILYLGLGFRGWAEGRIGDHAAAAASLARSAEVGAQLGQPLLLEDWFAMARADVAFCTGDIERAIALAECAVAAAQRASALFSRGLAHRIWAQALAAGESPRWDQADAHMKLSLELFEAGDARLPTVHTRMVWAGICRARGDIAGADEHVARATARFDASGLPVQLRGA